MSNGYQSELTPEQKVDALYDFIVAYKTAHDGNSPTLREIEASEDAPYNSTSHASEALRKLEERGQIRLAGAGRARSIEVVGARWVPPHDRDDVEDYLETRELMGWDF